MKKGKSILLSAAAVVASIFGTSALRPAMAADITLQNGNSTVVIDPDNSPGTAGVNSWTVNGVNQMNQDWYYYRIGNTGGQTAVNNLNEVSAPVVLNTSGGSGNDYAAISYANAGNTFQLNLTYSLTGGQTGSKVSDLAETVQIVNTSNSTLNYHFYQYANFNLGGVATGQNVSITGGNTDTQTNGGFSVGETVVSPNPNEFQAGSFPTIANALTSGTPLTLNDTASASGDGEWANEWDLTLAPGASFVISGDQQVRAAVPEPASSSLAILGMGGLFLTRPRRRDEDPDPRTAQVAEA